ncbi:hypothetical protein O6H91_09G088500 [Diphasiastrum complanatum]|uniref:Uncharacterized protein n=2 Tax=Diphasiastrum complanatum TaxID=34168 RepID=A0ACC2CRR9_DIPCM|nr:hypothetical protein O6H91_09G084100 [Diphasiastrum complanatum]KAJ7544668.1 hypothetical protein O6H91_09G088500 [Diphasiastrum complanatum]
MKKWRQQQCQLPSAALSAICFCSFAFRLIHASSSQSPAAPKSQEVLILLEFKQSLIDSDGNLRSWVASDTSPCNWKGVVCTNNTVTSVDLSYLNLNGTLSAVICQLRNLQSLNLTFNNFYQDFPYGLLGCTRLIVLDLSQNYFSGPLPHNISVLASSLTHLDLSGNFEGPIPDGFWELTNLRTLNLMGSSLSGTLSAQIGRLSNLTSLSLGWNPFSPAAIPAEIGNLTQLQYLSMPDCQFVNNIPPSIGALKQLHHLDLAENNLTGNIPSEIMQLSKLQRIFLHQNHLSGPLPPAFVNLTLLTDFYVAWNNLSGTIPKEISQLQHLRVFELYSNRFTGELPDGLADLPNLQFLNLYSNSFSGSIPRLLGKNSPLMQFDVTNNLLTGSMPAHLCDGGKLQNLSLINNKISGAIPDAYGSCPSLIRVQLYQNRLQGAVPAGLWGSPSMMVLDMAENDLNGSISSAIGKASQLSFLGLDNNRFSGDLPPEIGQLPKLNVFSAISNRLSGTIPFGNCTSLTSLSLAINSISGELPAEIVKCKSINYLDLAHNNLSGMIPENLAQLPNLNYLNLSFNHLSGAIPSQLGGMTFLSFNVSYNDLNGAVPPEFLKTLPVTDFEGNPNLCGEGLPRSCAKISNSTASKEDSGSSLVWILVGVIAAAVAFPMVAFIIVHRRSRVQPQRPFWEIKSFQKLGFSEESVANNLKEENVIGRGGFGKVYKVNLLDGEAVAVKKLCSSTQLKQGSKASHEMEVEIETLSGIRHRNIVSLMCCCSSNDAQLLVFEYMPNGSLGDVLHGQKVIPLGWQTRYKIALGAAEGLSYLHHDCHPAILHRDIKSNNILLNSDFEAKLADFGLAKLIQCGRPNSVTAVAGSYGYIAPEYTYTLKVDEKVDVYSFGVVLLELVTGKRPIEAEFGEEGDLVRWVRSKIHMKEGAIDLLDTRIRDSERAEMSMKLCLHLAMQCTSVWPEVRPSMRDVVEMLLQLNPSKNSSTNSWNHNNSVFMLNMDATLKEHSHFLGGIDSLP